MGIRLPETPLPRRYGLFSSRKPWTERKNGRPASGNCPALKDGDEPIGYNRKIIVNDRKAGIWCEFPSLASAFIL